MHHVLDEPLVVHCRRDKYEIYIGRPGAYANPFRLSDESEREAVVDRFAAWAPSQPEVLDMVRRYLPGKRLGCWCAPKACHGHVLVKLASTSLSPAPVFVFGSNRAGCHGKGAALDALQRFGAQQGVGEGRQGRSYAVPTKDAELNTLDLAEIRTAVTTLLHYARENPDTPFEITRIGCGLAGHHDETIATLFADAPSNCILPGRWIEILGRLSAPRIVVAGSRDFKDYAKMESSLNRLLERLTKESPVEAIEIVSGAAKGADSLGEDYAVKRGMRLRRMPADWERDSECAGPLRNQRMAWHATHLVAFWNGQSRGTRHMIDIARNDGLSVRVLESS